MRPGSLYDKITAIITLFLAILSVWNLTSPSPMPITQPYIPKTYPYTFKSVEVNVLAGKAELFFLIYHPPTFKDAINSVIYIKIYLTNYTPSFIGRGVSLAFVDVGLVYEDTIGNPPCVPIRIILDSEPDDILFGSIDLDCFRVGVYNVTIEIKVRILSILVIGWLPDRIVSQQLTTQINVTET